MAGEAIVTGLDKWKAKVAAIPDAAKAEIDKAINTNADKFMARVHQVIPKDTGDLESTIKKQQTGELYVTVTVGDAAHPYVAPLEFGHMDHGVHVPPRAFFFPTKRAMRRSFKARLSRAIKKAINALSVKPSGDDNDS